MELYHSSLCQWIVTTPDRAIQKAYEASKKVRKIQKEYLRYKNSLRASYRRSWYNVALYVDAVLNQSAAQISWGLLEFKVSIYLLGIFKINRFNEEIDGLVFKNNVLNPWNLNSVKDKSRLFSLRYDLKKQNDNSNLVNKSVDNSIKNFSFLSNITNQLDSNSKKNIANQDINNSILENNETELNNLYRKLAWIEAALADIEIFQNTYWNRFILVDDSPTESGKKYVRFGVLNSKSKDMPYESVGLVPRSITRTLSRFQTELEGRSASLVLPEFRLAKYQAFASLQYMAYLIFLPWISSLFCKIVFLEPLVENWWNTTQSQVFLSLSQEEKALRRLQEVEELLWLDIIMSDSSAKQPQDLSAQIHEKTIDLVQTYNTESINTVLNLFTDSISVLVIVTLFIVGKNRLAIFNSWVQEVFYSLSDTMKAFFILLLTDLCIGFHSPHGWEILIEFLLEHLGFSHNKHVISCFVSTFPVILDTVFKYWIFRHLNRISPSIVVSYHTMNE
jgi:hypothetical protein